MGINVQYLIKQVPSGGGRSEDKSPNAIGLRPCVSETLLTDPTQALVTRCYPICRTDRGPAPCHSCNKPQLPLLTSSDFVGRHEAQRLLTDSRPRSLRDTSPHCNLGLNPTPPRLRRHEQNERRCRPARASSSPKAQSRQSQGPARRHSRSHGFDTQTSHPQGSC